MFGLFPHEEAISCPVRMPNPWTRSAVNQQLGLWWFAELGVQPAKNLRLGLKERSLHAGDVGADLGLLNSKLAA